MGQTTTRRSSRELEWIFFAGGLSGMTINLPPSASAYQKSTRALTIDGAVQPREYLGRLVHIATRIQHLDDMKMTHESRLELYASTLELHRQLDVLASQTPKYWWAQNLKHVTHERVVHFFHYCVKMRVHLFFAMRQDPGGEYSYSYFACRDTCEAVAKHYQFLRQALPSGIFLSHTLDL